MCAAWSARRVDQRYTHEHAVIHGAVEAHHLQAVVLGVGGDQEVGGDPAGDGATPAQAGITQEPGASQSPDRLGHGPDRARPHVLGA